VRSTASLAPSAAASSPCRVDDDAGAEALVAEMPGRRMLARDARVDVHDAPREMLDELD
jgi:hypothetical protein